MKFYKNPEQFFRLINPLLLVVMFGIIAYYGETVNPRYYVFGIIPIMMFMLYLTFMSMFTSDRYITLKSIWKVLQFWKPLI